jgi:fluoride ion exporter CrcB/FEX
LSIGLTFARANPLACWVSTVVANLSGVFLVNFLLGRPLIQPLQDEQQLLIITGIW